VNKAGDHPENFGPYLDRVSTDPECEEIRHHTVGCIRCQDEVRNWQSLDALFRSRQDEIEVPPFQWQRIAAQIRQPAPAGVLARFALFFKPQKLVWNAVLATFLLGAVIFAGIEYLKNTEEKMYLLAITRYATVEIKQVTADGNPFQTASASYDNPFAKSPFAGNRKPSAERR
jgi:hypothetical protein